MSLVPTYVLATDGKFYRDPTIRGEGWFICFDDDPPELVLFVAVGTKAMKKQMVEAMGGLDRFFEHASIILDSLRIKHRLKNYIASCSDRCVDDKCKVMKPALSVFFEILSPIPPPTGQFGVIYPTRTECTLYAPGLSDEDLRRLRTAARVPKDSASPPQSKPGRGGCYGGRGGDSGTPEEG